MSAPLKFITGIALLVASLQPLKAAGIYGSDNFSSGINPIQWTVVDKNHGTMTVAGTNGHASFIVPQSATSEQNAYLLWSGRPRLNADWSVEARGRNTAPYSASGGSSIQLGVVDARLLSGQGTYNSFSVEFGRSSSASALGEFQYWVNPGPDAPTEKAAAASSVAEFGLRVIYRDSEKRFESWYDDTGLGTNWKLMRYTPLSQIVPDATATTEMAVALLSNTYYGPISEGQLWVDDFQLVDRLLEVPVVTTQPVSQAVAAGNGFTLSVGATGTGLSYQWRKNGVTLAGGTGATYSIASAQFADAGTYTVVVSNSSGGVTSGAATVAVNAGSVFGSDNFSSGINPSQWTVVDKNHGTMTVAGTNGHASFIVPQSSTSEQNALLVWAGRPRLNADWSVELRGRNTALYSGNGGSSIQLGVADARLLSGEGTYNSFSVEFGRSSSASALGEFQYWVNPGPDSPSDRVAAASSVTEFRLRVIYRDKEKRFESWYDETGLGMNWKLLRNTPLSQIVPDATPTSEMVVLLLANTYHGPISEGQLWVDDFRLMDKALDIPVITVQPAGQSLSTGETATFGVTAAGEGLSYQWRKDGADITGATGSAYTIASLKTTDAGNYSVSISNDAGSVASGTASLVVMSVPSKPVLSGTLTAIGTVGVPFSYQITATNGPTAFTASGLPPGLSLNANSGLISGTPTTGGQSTVTLGASNAGGASSASLTLTIQALMPPSITTHPQPRGEFAGGTVSFSVAASGAGLSYQWRRNGIPISGGTLATYTIRGVLLANAGNYDVVVSNSTGSVTSRFAALTVNSLPVIGTHPVSATVEAGKAAALSVAATGADLSYQWQKDTVDIPQAVGAVYAIPLAGLVDGGSYRAVVTSRVLDGGTLKTRSVASNAAELKVVPKPEVPAQPLAITIQPLEVKVTAGFPAVFSVGAVGGGTIGYQWRKNGVAISGQTGPSYKIDSVQKEDEAVGSVSLGYDVVVTSGSSSVTSARVGMTVVEGGAYIIENPTGTSVKPGSSYTMQVTTADLDATFQWRKNGSPISGATGSSYSLSGIKADDAGRYDVVIKNAFGEVWSSPAYLGVASKVTPNLQRVSYRWINLAGNGVPGAVDGSGLSAQFNNPSSIAMDGLGNLYVSDTGNHAIRRVTQSGLVTTVAGSLANAGTVNGTANWPVGVKGAARFDSPEGIAVDGSGAVYIAEPASNTVRKLAFGSSSGTVSTVAGSMGQFGLAGGLNSPRKVAVDKQGKLYVMDEGSIRRVDGLNSFTLLLGESGTYTGGKPVPLGMAIGSTGNIFAAANDAGEFRIFASIGGGAFQATNYGPYLFPITDLTVGAGNNLYASNGDALLLLGDMSQATPNSGLPFNITTSVDGYAAPGAAVVDAEGTAYAVDSFSHVVIKGVPSGLPVFLQPLAASNLPKPSDQAVLLSARVVGTGTISYQWFRNGSRIAGATASDYTVAAGTAFDGDYTVEASNQDGTVTSEVVTKGISVSTQLQIVQGPVGAGVVEGDPFELAVMWNGPATTKFQWYRNRVAVSGGTASAIAFPKIRGTDAGDYYVVLTGSSQSITSGTAKLAVYTPVAIFSQPEDVAVETGTDVSVRVTATGTPPFTYQWRKNGVSVPGANQSSYSFNATESGAFDVQVSNIAGRVETSRAALVSVLDRPVLTSQPAELSTVNQGTTHAFQVFASGSGPLGYQWRKDGLPISGGTSATLELKNVQGANTGFYDVVVSNSVGNVTSRASRLSVNFPASIVSQPPGVISATVGTPVSLRVVPGGTGPFVYQWLLDGNPIQGATGQAFTAPALRSGSSRYSVRVTSEAFGNTVTSAVTELRVTTDRSISVLQKPPQQINIIRGTAATLRLSVDADPSDALRTTYRLVAAGSVSAGNWTKVGSGGFVEIPLGGLTNSGSYSVVFSREYQDGQVVTDVQTDPFSVQLRTLEDAAGNYELLLNDSNGLVGDGATHRGLVVATVNRTGSVSGRVLYTEAAPLAGAPGTERTYTSVTRSFSAVFSPSESNLSKLVCAPRIGLGAQANRQELELELDFSTPLVELNATVRDRISVAAETDGEACISQGVGAVRGFTKLAGNFSSLEGRYVLGTGIGYSQSSGPNAENNAAMLVQVLSTGRVLWASRLTGATGTGSANLSTDDDLEAKAQFYEGRTLSSTTVHSTSSLFGELRFRSDITGGSWSAFVGSAAGEGLLERQSCYISKVAKAPVYDAARFDVSMAGDPSYNWSGVSLLSFRDGTSCRWTGATNAGLQAFLNPEGASASSPIPLLYLSAEDPDSEGTYLWTLAVSNTGTVKTANYSLTDSQPVLTMRLDRIRGEWSGSYVSPLTKKRRTLVGVLTRPASGGSLRGAGWVELGVLPSTLSSGWEIDLDPPGK